jgi:mRNA interferase MazF
MTYYIVEALYPFSEQNQVKKRPVLVLTEPRSKFKSVIVAFITSRIYEELSDSDLILEPDTDNGLVKKSLVKLHKLAVLEPSSIGEIIGELNDENTKQVKEKLGKLFNL